MEGGACCHLSMEEKIFVVVSLFMLGLKVKIKTSYNSVRSCVVVASSGTSLYNHSFSVCNDKADIHFV